jgi:glycosyltransferase involved in cell wall biosynthesis
MMQVVLVVNALLRHGPGMVVDALAKGLTERGNRVTVVSLDSPDRELEAGLMDKGIAVIHLPAKPKTVQPLANMLREQRAHVLHLHGVKADLIGRPAGRLASVPAVLSSMHDTPSMYALILGPARGAMLSLAEIGTMWLAHRVVMVSEATARAFSAPLLSRILGLKRRFRTIYNGIPDCAITEPDQPNTSRSPVVGTLAGLTPRKGIDYLIKAAHVLQPAYPDIRFVVAGEGPHRYQLEERIHALGLQDSFSLPGLCRDIDAFLAEIAVFVLPSLDECLPLAILEAMSAGKPVVATPVGGIREAVVQEETGLIVPPADAQALASALDRLLGDADLREHLGRSARARYLSLFSVDRMVDQYMVLYQEMLVDKSRYTDKEYDEGR